MSKKQKLVTEEVKVATENTAPDSAQKVESTQETKVNAKVDKKADKNKAKKKEKKHTVAKKTKETVSELKKVTWTTFPTVVKRTGVVLAVVIIFAVVLFGIDLLLGLASSALMGKPFNPFG